MISFLKKDRLIKLKKDDVCLVITKKEDIKFYASFGKNEEEVPYPVQVLGSIAILLQEGNKKLYKLIKDFYKEDTKINKESKHVTH
jgi:hypothetical protein